MRLIPLLTVYSGRCKMSDRQVTIRDLVAKLLTSCAPRYVLHLQFEECRLRIATNSTELRRQLGDYYQSWCGHADTPDVDIVALEAGPPDLDDRFKSYARAAGKRGVKEEYLDLSDGRVIRKRRTGMVFLLGALENVAVGDSVRNVHQVINFIDNRYMEWCLERGGELLHAAGVACGHQGIAIAANSGKGKSTLALHLVSRGLDFVSNDRVVLDARLPGLRMFGLAKQPRVNPGTLLHNPDLAAVLPRARRAQLETTATEELWELEEKYDVDIRRQFGPRRHILLARLTALVVLNWDRSGEPIAVRPADLDVREDLVDVIAKTRGVFRRGPVTNELSQFERVRLVRMLGECPIHEITGGIQFQAAVDACLELLCDRRAGYKCS